MHQSTPKGNVVDIVDAQLHIGHGMIDAILEAMNSLGIKSVLIDEFWVNRVDESPKQINPGYRLENGAWRAAYPAAELASILYPDRFSYFVRLDRHDPELESVMRVVGSSPHARAFRLLATWTLDEATAFSNGGYEPLFDIAQDVGLPLCLMIPGYVEFLPQYLKKYANLTFVVDHWGLGMPNHPPGRPEKEALRAQHLDYFDEVLKLAEHPNVAIKISHAHFYFGAHEYPYDPVRPYLRRAIEAFGADRLMWASDKTVIPHHTWSDLLHYLRDDPELSQEEKEWILGRTARRILNWRAA
jgi:predicted TIM-barrel fold metal-dependent hydrolase